MQIDESDEQYANADSPIDESRESDSNVIVERELHPRKHWPSFSTDEGMQILHGISVLLVSGTHCPKSTTSIRTPPSETQLRGKTDPEVLEKSHDAFLPSVL
jgi:hypothetical protein